MAGWFSVWFQAGLPQQQRRLAIAADRPLAHASKPSDTAKFGRELGS
jgi:hypothetical protein